MKTLTSRLLYLFVGFYLLGSTILYANLSLSVTSELSPEDEWHHESIEVPAELEGLRIVVSSEDGSPELYLSEGDAPISSTGEADYEGVDWLDAGTFTSTLNINAGDLTEGTWQVSVRNGGSTSLTFVLTAAEQPAVVELDWDEGDGSNAFSETSSSGGLYQFRLDTQDTQLGAWRQALSIEGGSAQFFSREGQPATASDYDYASEPSDFGAGWVFALDTSGVSSTVWHITVAVEPGADWSVVAGDVPVVELGELAADDASGSFAYDQANPDADAGVIPGEGVRFFRTTLPQETLAWRLWLQTADGDETWLTAFDLREGAVPIPGDDGDWDHWRGEYDYSHSGQALMVPPEISPGDGSNQYIAVRGEPGTEFRFDSRQQPVTPISFGEESTEVYGDGGAWFHTFEVSVPDDILGWEVTSLQESGDPFLSARRDEVAHADYNDAFSEVEGGVSNSFTFVSPYLSDGTYFITVYSDDDFSFRLRNEEPVVTTIDYESTTENDESDRVGWRYFQMLQSEAQVLGLGWMLDLEEAPDGTRIAIREGDLPGRINYRDAGNESTVDEVYEEGEFGYLQRPGHGNETLYIGVYAENEAMSDFTLLSGPLTAPTMEVAGGEGTVSDLRPDEWAFFRFELPEEYDGHEVLGWELRAHKIEEGFDAISLRRAALPEGTGASSNLGVQTSWSGDVDSPTQYSSRREWSGRHESPDGSRSNEEASIGFGMGQPLEPGTYYFGIKNDDSHGLAEIDWASRLIGPEGSGFGYEITELGFNDDSISGQLQPREVAYHVVEVPENQESWRVRLELPDEHEAHMILRKDHLPNPAVNHDHWSNNIFEPLDYQWNTNLRGRQVRIASAGNEYYKLWPRGSYIEPGTYYIMVVAEGQNPDGNQIGDGAVDYTLISDGNIPVQDLGLIDEGDVLTLSDEDFEDGIPLNYYRFELPEETLGLQLRVEDVSGDVDLGIHDGYFPPGMGEYQYNIRDAEWEGDELIYMTNPAPGVYGMTVVGDSAEDRYTLDFSGIEAESYSYTGVEVNVTDHPPGEWVFFEIEIPDEEALLGWEVQVPEWIATSDSARPTMAISRSTLPTSTWGNWSSFTSPSSGVSWSEGHWIAKSAGEWTGLATSADGSQTNETFLFSIPMGQPLEPGTYYIGFRAADGADAPLEYTWTSRAIGEAGSGYEYEVETFDFDGGTVTGELDPRGLAYYKVEIPEDTYRSWSFELNLPNADEGEDAQLYVRQDFLPNTESGSSSDANPADPRGDSPHQLRLQKEGNEHFVMWPDSTDDYIEAGTYYFMVVSEGQNPDPDSNQIGEGTVSYELISHGEVEVEEFELDIAGEATVSGSYEPGRQNLYRFEIPEDVLAVEFRLEDTEGEPAMNVLHDEIPPRIGTIWSTWYGYFSGRSGDDRSTSLINLTNPEPGTYSMVVAPNEGTGNHPEEEGSYTLSVNTVGAIDVDLDGASESISDIGPGEWRYYRVEIPENEELNGHEILGWEVRVNGWSGDEAPFMAISRGDIPPDGATADGTLSTSEYRFNWTEGRFAATASGNWTGRDFSADGSQEYDQILITTAMGQPLQSGTYYIGFRNESGSESLDLDWTSRLVGPEGSGFSYEVEPLDYADGEATGTLGPREVAYYAIDVPEATPSWELHLDVEDGGVAHLLFRDEHIPNSRVFGLHDGNDDPSSSQVRLQLPGDQRFTYWPASGDSSIEPGRYYLMVAGGGQSPEENNRIGSGDVSYTLHSLGEVEVNDVGSLAVGDQIVEEDQSYTAGEINYYRFDLDSDVDVLELQLVDRDGTPAMTLALGDLAPHPQSSSATNPLYGTYSGQPDVANGSNYIALGNPDGGTYTLAVSHDSLGGDRYGAGGYTLQINAVEPTQLEFGFAGSMDTGSLFEGESDFYQITAENVASHLGDRDPDPEEVIGWKLQVDESTGDAEMRVRFEAAPQDHGSTSDQSTWRDDTFLIVPPYFESGDWYVEVRGESATDYTITSEPITVSSMEREIWEMPEIGQTSEAPGLEGAVFGDTGISEDGSDLPEDQGVDLSNGDFHLYAITIPESNGGLLRTVLETLSGEPSLHLRPGYLPTADHREEGGLGSIYLHRMTSSSDTQRASWVPYTVLEDTTLEPGVWYLMVRAEEDTSARYRLRLSHHAETLVQDLTDVEGGYDTQPLTAGDWRYYKVEFPEEPADMPLEWTVNFERDAGNAEMYIRDSAPPGYWQHTSHNSHSNPIDWDTEDLYLVGPYERTYGEGEHTFEGRFLRPGKTYYIGVNGGNDTVFSIDSDMSDQTLGSIYGLFYSMDGTGGEIDITLDPGETRTYEIDFPEEARRWRSFAEHDSSIEFYIGAESYLADLQDEQLNQDVITGESDWVENGNRGRLFRPSSHRDYPNTFYMTIVNTSEEEQPVWFFVDWRQTTDFEHGVSADGEGSIVLDPEPDEYTSGNTVTMTAEPDIGWQFSKWTGDVESEENPLEVTEYEELSVVAEFVPHEGIYIADAEVLTEQLFVGDGPGPEVEIELTITNNGSAGDTITPELYFEADGDEWTVEPDDAVEVGAGETEVVTYTYDMEEVVVTWDAVPYEVTVNDTDAGQSFEAGSFIGSYVQIYFSPGEIDTGSVEEIDFYAYGMPEEALETELTLEINGDQVDSIPVTIEEDDYVYETFEWVFYEPGEYTVSVNGILAEDSPFTVVGDPVDPGEGIVEITDVDVASTFETGETLQATVHFEETGGQDSGAIEVVFAIDGDEIDRQSQTVQPGSSGSLEFSHVFAEAGTFELTFNDESYQVTVDYADIDTDFSDLQVSSTELFGGQFVTVTANVENLDAAAGEYAAQFTVHDMIGGALSDPPVEVHTDTASGTLDGNASATVRFHYLFYGPGEYEVFIDRLDPIALTVISGWPQYGHGHTNSFSGAFDGPSMNVTERWQTDLVADGSAPVRGAPIVVDGVAYVGSHAAELHAIDAATGDPIWTEPVATDGPVERSAAYADGRVFVATTAAEGGEVSLHAVDAVTGDPLWTASDLDSGAVTAAPVVVGDSVYLVAGGTTLYAFAADDGHEQWTYTATGQTTSATPAYAHGVLYLGTDDGVEAVELATGSAHWDEPYAAGLVAPGLSVASIDGDWIVFAATEGGQLHAIDADTGASSWDLPVDLAGTPGGAPTVAGQDVYIGDSEGFVYKFDGNNGALGWEDPFEADGAIQASMAYATSRVHFGTSAGTVYALPGFPDDPQPVWTHSVGSGIRSATAIDNEVVYFGDEAGHLTALHGLDEEPEPGDAPEIVTGPSPAEQTLAHGETLTYSVEAEGDDLEYQWRRNGTSLMPYGDHAEFTIAAVSKADEGDYTVFVRNAFGVAESAAVSLSVELPPELPDSVGDADVLEVDEDSGTSVYNSEWLGVFYAIEGGSGWIYSERIGWIYVWPGQASGTMWFWDPLADLVFFTDEEIHPFVYSETVGFAVYARGGDGRRYLHVLSDEEILDLDLEP